MKQLSLLALGLCFFLAEADAATMDGMVINCANGSAASGAAITVNTGSSTLTATSNATGYYSIALPASLASGTMLTVSVTIPGGGGGTGSRMYQGTSLTENLFAPGPGMMPTTRALCGTVFTGMNTPSTGNAKVWIIQKKYDPALMDTTLTAIDSVLTTSTGAFCKVYSSTTIPSGKLLVKAALLSSHASYPAFLPTYFGYVTPLLNWPSAASLDSSSFGPIQLRDIDLAAGTNPGGAGFIGGSVLLGANKSAAVGDPLSSRILLLTTQGGSPVAYAYSDAAGKFSFPGLAFGTYRIFGDALGKSNPQLTVTISASNKTVNNIIFEENSKKFEGRQGNNLEVAGSLAELGEVRVYPNPARDYLQVRGLERTAGMKQVKLLSVDGKTVRSFSFDDGEQAVLSLEALAPGLYQLYIRTENGQAVRKVVKY